MCLDRRTLDRVDRDCRERSSRFVSIYSLALRYFRQDNPATLSSLSTSFRQWSLERDARRGTRLSAGEKDVGRFSEENSRHAASNDVKSTLMHVRKGYSASRLQCKRSKSFYTGLVGLGHVGMEWVEEGYLVNRKFTLLTINNRRQ